MNKLKKRSPDLFTHKPAFTSMTMQYATTMSHGNSQPTVQRTQMAAIVTAEEFQPKTPSEHYWAARASKSEALLVAQEAHREEVKTLGHHQELKRERELSLLAKEYKEKHAALERLLIFLLILIGVLVMLIIYLSTYYTRNSFSQRHKDGLGWWSAIGASHFTIPILSPFTSVVEHEASIIGTKLIGTLATIAACLVYVVFRYWLSHKRTTSDSSSLTSMSSSTRVVTQAILPATPRSIDR